MKSSALCPYQSFHVFHGPKLSEAKWRSVLADIANAFYELLPKAAGQESEVVSSARAEKSTEGARTAWLAYKKVQPPSWFVGPDADVRDIEHHVIVVVAAGEFVSVTASDKSLAGRVDRVRLALAAEPLRSLSRIAPERMEGALIHGRARMLWMSAIHREQDIRPNAKVLMGSNLAVALDPLGDQTFHYTAVRCDGPISGGVPVFGVAPGVSPRKGRVWLQRSASYEDLASVARELMHQIAVTKIAARSPFPLLASPLSSIAGVEQAFDFAFLPPDFANADVVTGQSLEDLKGCKWQIVGAAGSSKLQMVASIDGHEMSVPMRLQEVDGQVSMHVMDAGPIAQGSPRVAAAIDVFKSDAFKVYFESGHTYSGCALYSVATRPVPFVSGVDSDAFRDTDITQEKPMDADLSKIGLSGERSLFTWVWRHYSAGFLWCDDGAGEIADFVHMHNGTLTLIHVKAASSAESNRKIAVSPYEVVCAQALKNIRMLEASDLHEQLAKKVLAKSKWRRSWENGQPMRDPSEIPSAIRKIPYSSMTRRCLVVQPHVTRAQIERPLASNGASDSAEVRRALQLHTMLNAFAASFRNLGIDFKVVFSA